MIQGPFDTPKASTLQWTAPRFSGEHATTLRHREADHPPTCRSRPAPVCVRIDPMRVRSTTPEYPAQVDASQMSEAFMWALPSLVQPPTTLQARQLTNMVPFQRRVGIPGSYLQEAQLSACSAWLDDGGDFRLLAVQAGPHALPQLLDALTQIAQRPPGEGVQPVRTAPAPAGADRRRYHGAAAAFLRGVCLTNQRASTRSPLPAQAPLSNRSSIHTGATNGRESTVRRAARLALAVHLHVETLDAVSAWMVSQVRCRVGGDRGGHFSEPLPDPGVGLSEHVLDAFIVIRNRVEGIGRQDGSGRLHVVGRNDPVLCVDTVSYTHLRAHETPEHLVCRLLLEKKKKKKKKSGFCFL
eukprot:TRINITY_DN907_c0_g1_i2.p1 TRINITY_DN907_c0_g1~~TRINITY_DN907_c0_g1_i2.p1  ORF type:complete len:355 (-),score=37.73 TRINITY_DN907_c0_g1_i2:134-1198(-)